MNSSRNNTLLSIYDSSRTVFSIKGLSLLFGEERATVLSKRLNYYVREGRLLNPRRGFYAKRNYNPEELACMLYTPSYLSLEYVLQKAGVIFQYDTRYTAVSYLTRSLKIDEYEFSYRCAKGEVLADTRGIECRANVNIATPERAFLDMIYLNSAYYFDNLNILNREKVFELLPIYANKQMETRVTTLLSRKK